MNDEDFNLTKNELSGILTNNIKHKTPHTNVKSLVNSLEDVGLGVLKEIRMNNYGVEVNEIDIKNYKLSKS